METVFKNLEQRVVGGFIDTFPSFIPCESSEVEQTAQKHFYDFIRKIYFTIFNDPLILFSKLNEDDFYTYRFNKAFDKKPKLYETMKSDTKKIDDLLSSLFKMGLSGTIKGDSLIIDSATKISKKHFSVLEECGLSFVKENNSIVCSIKNGNDIFRAMKWMAARPGALVLSFSRCLFDPEYSYASDVFSRLLGNEKAFAELEQFLNENGYKRIDNRDNQIALDYVKNYDKKDMPVKDSWAERSHGGISLKYYGYVEKPACISLRIPSHKKILGNSDLMEQELKAFVINKNKKCDNCRYCVQTDKTGKRNFIYITVNSEKEYKLCPLFPGFDFCWDYIDQNLSTNMIASLKFINNMMK